MRRAVVAILAVCCMAPTVGDVGGCGKTATELDPEDYAVARKNEDCRRCKNCAIETTRCKNACDPKKPPDIELPVTCKPIRHDGEVCLRALRSASCDTFASYVDDDAPASPSECNFCLESPSQSTPGFVNDAGDQ